MGNIQLPVSENVSQKHILLCVQRQTYRHYNHVGPKVDTYTLSQIFGGQDAMSSTVLGSRSSTLPLLTIIGDLLQSLTALKSNERLLDKYTYPPGGALYSVQLYVVLTGVDNGVYYHDHGHNVLMKLDCVKRVSGIQYSEGAINPIWS